MKLREAFEEHYEKDELSARYLQTMWTVVRSWEKLTGNPEIETLTNADVEAWKRAALQAGLAPVTINGNWTTMRSILRRVGPVTDGNPWALDLFPGWRVPAMRPCKVQFKRPERLTMEELDRLYLAARHMRQPSHVVDPVAFWQGLIVFGYFTAFRSADIFGARWSDINFEDRTIYIKTGKTGVEADFPLVDEVLAHLRRIRESSNQEFIFPITTSHYYDNLVQRMHKQSNVRLRLHDLRRTCCSEVEAVAPGMGDVVGLWKPTGVVRKHYLNAMPELRPALEKMARPISFRHGPKMVQRAVKIAKQKLLNVQDFSVPVIPPREAFQFVDGGVRLGAYRIPLQNLPLQLLKRLVAEGCIASAAALQEAVGIGRSLHYNRERLQTAMTNVRMAMRTNLPLPVGFNPIVGRSDSNKRLVRDVLKFDRYELLLPPTLWEERPAK